MSYTHEDCTYPFADDAYPYGEVFGEPPLASLTELEGGTPIPNGDDTD